MRVLVIDDDYDIRQPIINGFWVAQGAEEVIWLTKWPKSLFVTLKENKITHLSLDHDLGDSDVSTELNILKYVDFDLFCKELCKINVTIHSMNPVGAESIYFKLFNIAQSVRILPLFNMQ